VLELTVVHIPGIDARPRLVAPGAGPVQNEAVDWTARRFENLSEAPMVFHFEGETLLGMSQPKALIEASVNHQPEEASTDVVHVPVQ
jgi:hypothetical protein